VPKDNPIIELDANSIHYGQISIFGASDSTAENHYEAMNLLASGGISTDLLITHTLGIDDFFKGIDLINRREALKVVIQPNG